jgi:hypothetical protein
MVRSGGGAGRCLKGRRRRAAPAGPARPRTLRGQVWPPLSPGPRASVVSLQPIRPGIQARHGAAARAGRFLISRRRLRSSWSQGASDRRPGTSSNARPRPPPRPGPARPVHWRWLRRWAGRSAPRQRLPVRSRIFRILGVGRLLLGHARYVRGRGRLVAPEKLLGFAHGSALSLRLGSFD